MTFSINFNLRIQCFVCINNDNITKHIYKDNVRYILIYNVCMIINRDFTAKHKIGTWNLRGHLKFFENILLKFKKFKILLITRQYFSVTSIFSNFETRCFFKKCNTSAVDEEKV